MTCDPIASVSLLFASLGLPEADYRIEREDDDVNEGLRGWYVAAMDQSWEMHLDDAQVIESVTLYPRRFEILNLPLDANRATIRYRFGQPAASGEHPDIANVRDGAWDKYQRDGLYYHFEYQPADEVGTYHGELPFMTENLPNNITGPNAGGPRQFPIRTPLAARVGQFWRSVAKSLVVRAQLWSC